MEDVEDVDSRVVAGPPLSPFPPSLPPFGYSSDSNLKVVAAVTAGERHEASHGTTGNDKGPNSHRFCVRFDLEAKTTSLLPTAVEETTNGMSRCGPTYGVSSGEDVLQHNTNGATPMVPRLLVEPRDSHDENHESTSASKSTDIFKHDDDHDDGGGISSTSPMRSVVVDVCVTEFADKHLVLICENRRPIATWVEAYSDRRESAVFGVRVLFGDRRNDYPLVCGRDLISHVAKSGSEKSILLGINLQLLSRNKSLLACLLQTLKDQIDF